MTNTIPSLWVRISGGAAVLTNPRQLSGLRVQQRLGFPAQCEITLNDCADLIGSVGVGQSLEVSILSTDGNLFDGDVTAVEYIYPAGSPPALRIRGYDLLHRLRQRQQVRAYHQCSLLTLLRELGGAGSELQGENLQWQLLIQHQQNDLEFLAGQAAAAGCYPLAREGVLYLVPLSGLRGHSGVTLSYGTNLFEARIENNINEDCGAVSVFGWETAASGALRWREGTPTRQGRSLINMGLADDQQARALAQAELGWRSASRLVLWARAEGSSALQPGVPVNVTGIAAELSGRFVLTSVTHTFDFSTGYTVELSSEPPPVPPRSRCDTAALGLVSDAADPQRLGRVRARLPGYGDVETGWMPVVCPAAGKNKGFTALPDVSDRVLVLLAREDPARGIVLGGLYAPEHPPDDGVESHCVERYTWQSADGQRIQFDRDGHLVRIENGAGARIEMEGDHITIQAGRINFRRS